MNEDLIKIGKFIFKKCTSKNGTDFPYITISTANTQNIGISQLSLVAAFDRVKELEAENKNLRGHINDFIIEVWTNNELINENEKLKARVKELIEFNHRLFDKNQEYAAKIEKMADELSSIGPTDVENEQLRARVKELDNTCSLLMAQQKASTIFGTNVLINENRELKVRVKELENEWSTEMNRKPIFPIQIGPPFDPNLTKALKAVEKKLKTIRKGLYED